MSDFNIQIKVRNGRLLRAIRNVSDSTSDFCRKSGVAQSQISALLTMRESPIKKKSGDWREIVHVICSHVGCEPDQLWPHHMQRMLLKKSEAEIELSAAEVFEIAGNSDQDMTNRKLLAHFAKTLTPRQIECIGRRQRGETLEQIAVDFGVNRERIRQLELKGLSKMRRAAMVKGYRTLSDVLD